ncbi:hypothetical protein BDV95DRAFT_674389 [Massariosphaeria phaeospora]|uniref:F-box domain-containing protein n=1 Tax=Massariosphaeria phaeospora TaxID=100035 RepID=A0A7C8IH29_9PLEO|nr:hypothetical protein BDV95DRAFT_674389 [Massariosphaeria phaeospora]
MQLHGSDDEEPLEDTTATIPLHSKRTERLQRKQATRDRKRDAVMQLTKLPTEIILESLELLQPNDVLNFGLVNRRFHSLVSANANVIGDAIICQRYKILAQCFFLPKLLSEVDASIRPLLVASDRQAVLSIHNRPYQHIQPPDPALVCTCLTCVLTWNNLGLVLDFAHWQDNLDHGEPLPMIPRGQTPEWNRKLIQRNADMVRKALHNSLWHARIMEIHLDSTVRAIKRHAGNRGNKRKHVEMTVEEAATGTDDFLTKEGPPSLEFPYHRDNYYMLEAYLPTRYWKKFEHRWVYTFAGNHEQDLQRLVNPPKK